MILGSTLKKLQVVLTAAMTTANMPVVVDYVDLVGLASGIADSQLSNTNGVTRVDILAAPAASTQRKVNSISIVNRDSATKTVSVIFNDNGTDYYLATAILDSGDSLSYTDTSSWTVTTSDGSKKSIQTITTTNVTSIDGGAAATVYAAATTIDGGPA